LIGLVAMISCTGGSDAGQVFVRTLDTISQQPVGGRFENSEYTFIGMPAEIASMDTSPGIGQEGQKLLITGHILAPDGRTPVPDVVLYYYHTDVSGRYADKPGLDPRVKRHGYIRGWVKSDPQGRYAIYTVRPAPYPGGKDPAHIHPAIKEPGIGMPYYIDEFVFDDDPLLTKAKRTSMENRGGSGILRLLVKGDLQVAEHDIILGLNIPNYPTAASRSPKFGLAIGEDQPSFIPFHAWGPDRGSRACPVCKYGRYHGILYFVGDHPDMAQVKKWLAFLEAESMRRGKYLKAYFVLGNSIDFDPNVRRQELESIGLELGLERIALTFVPSLSDQGTEVHLNRLHNGLDNAFVLFRNGTIVDSFANLPPTTDSFERITSALDHTRSEYFELPRVLHD
jgi:protocatechuate 3,4-dioxygenase, beta subunit